MGAASWLSFIPLWLTAERSRPSRLTWDKSSFVKLEALGLLAGESLRLLCIDQPSLAIAAHVNLFGVACQQSESNILLTYILSDEAYRFGSIPRYHCLYEMTQDTL